jgi:hypothetical protein
MYKLAYDSKDAGEFVEFPTIFNREELRITVRIRPTRSPRAISSFLADLTASEAA